MDASHFYRLFRQACQTHQLYPPESPVRVESASRLSRALADSAQPEGVSVVFLDECAFVDGQPVPGGLDEVGPPLWRRIFELGVGELRFLPGLDEKELSRLLDLLARAQQGLLNPVDEDLSVLLWESELAHVSYWLYEDDSWLNDDLAQTGAGVGDEFQTLIEAAERDEQAVSENRLFLSAADAVLNIASDEGPSSTAGETRSVPYRGMPLNEYLDEELTIASDLPTGAYARLSEGERIAILSAFRREVTDVVPWKYGRLLVEVLRLETDPLESTRIEQLLMQYIEVLLEAERFELLAKLAREFKPRREGALVPPAVARAAARLNQSAVLSAAGRFALDPRSAAQPSELDGAFALLNDAPIEPLLDLKVGAEPSASGRLDSLLRRRLTTETEALLKGLEHPERAIRWFAMECAVESGPEAHRRLRELARDGEAETRCRAVQVLKNSQEPSTLALLSGALHDPEPVVRIAAAEALADQGGARALEPLLRVLVGKEFDKRAPDERRLFFVAAGRAAPREVLPVLARLAEQRGFLGRGDQAERADCALAALVDLRTEATPYLRERWGTKRRDLWRRFDALLATRGEATVRTRRAA